MEEVKNRLNAAALFVFVGLWMVFSFGAALIGLGLMMFISSVIRYSINSLEDFNLKIDVKVHEVTVRGVGGLFK